MKHTKDTPTRKVRYEVYIKMLEIFNHRADQYIDNLFISCDGLCYTLRLATDDHIVSNLIYDYPELMKHHPIRNGAWWWEQDAEGRGIRRKVLELAIKNTRPISVKLITLIKKIWKR